MARAAVVAVGAVPWMRSAKALVEGRKNEVLVEEVEHRDTAGVQGVVEAVGCSGEGKERAVRVRVWSSGWVRKQGGSNWLPQACAKRRAENETAPARPAQTTHLENSRVYYFVKE